ncbi:MAG: UDP-3-O-(3-hydroxymyristoyl)glucosamine N-acyltransferase [Candidatus Obscuribacterales bacterium]|nr:UDP-3-O-(3-hydroxymyristoyl)glucosamine N-acyltransferase [Candidatus Obscuribacterales bacterium]
MKLPKAVSIQEIAMLIGGKTECKEDVKVTSVSLSPLKAQEGEVAFLFDPKVLSRLSECNASIVIIPTGTKCSSPCIYVDRPLLAIQKILTFFQPKRFFPDAGVHPTAVVDPTAELAEGVAVGPYVVIGPQTKIGANTKIMPHCYVGGKVEIGKDCLLYPGCLVADYVKLGDRVILQQGAVLGSDGFAYVTAKPSNIERRLAGGEPLDESNPHLKIPQIGNVIIEDDVEIGSCATVDRATMGATVIGKGTKIDNLVMIAHNVKIGQEALVVAQVAIGGSCTLADRAIVAGHAAIKDHVHIGKDSIVQGHAGVMKDIEDGAVVAGAPSVSTRDFMANAVYMKKMPQLYKDLKEMKKQIAELEKQLSQVHA